VADGFVKSQDMTPSPAVLIVAGGIVGLLGAQAGVEDACEFVGGGGDGGGSAQARPHAPVKFRRQTTSALGPPRRRRPVDR
jgi:hypothetical protein